MNHSLYLILIKFGTIVLYHILSSSEFDIFTKIEQVPFKISILKF